MKKLVIALVLFISTLTYAKREQSSYNVDVNERDPFIKGSISAPVIGPSLPLEAKIKEALKIKGVVMISGEACGVFNTGMHKKGDTFDLKLDIATVKVKVVSLNVSSRSAVIEIYNKKYIIKK